MFQIKPSVQFSAKDRKRGSGEGEGVQGQSVEAEQGQLRIQQSAARQTQQAQQTEQPQNQSAQARILSRCVNAKAKEKIEVVFLCMICDGDAEWWRCLIKDASSSARSLVCTQLF